MPSERFYLRQGYSPANAHTLADIDRAHEQDREEAQRELRKFEDEALRQQRQIKVRQSWRARAHLRRTPWRE